MQKQYPLGGIISPVDRRDLLFATVVMPKILPRKYSLRDKQSPVAVQIYGSCEGFAAKSLKEFQNLRDEVLFKPLSGRGVYALCKANDGLPDTQGTYTRTMLKIIAGIGVPYDEDFPNEPKANHREYISGMSDAVMERAHENRISGYAAVTSIDDLKQAIIQFGDCPITIPVYDDYLSMDERGLIRQPAPNAQFIGMHEVVAVGWDDDLQAIEFKNNWGIFWGTQQGYGFMPYAYNGRSPIMESFSTVDTIDAQATSGAPVALAYPVDEPAYITQYFGARPDYYKKYGLDGHNGTDFRAKTGANTKVCDDGTILFTGIKGSYGNAIVVQHTWGTSIYAHLLQFLCIEGQQVKKGQVIAKTDGQPGSQGAGDSDAPHLHFGIRINGVRNPGFADYANAEPYFKKGKPMELPVYKLQGQPAIYALVGQFLVPFTSMDVLTDVFPNMDVIELPADQFAKFDVVPDIAGGKHVGIGIY